MLWIAERSCIDCYGSDMEYGIEKSGKVQSYGN